MRSLLIDTTSSFITVGIVEDNKILYLFHKNLEKDIASKMMSIIDKGLKECILELKDIDKIFVCNGPGSFTGIRVGVTIAKTIAWSLKKEIIPISSLELIATTPISKEYIIPMIDARRGNVFSGIYDKDLNRIKEDMLVSLDSITNDGEFVSYDNIENSIKPSIDILKIINKHMSDSGVNPHNLNPRYLKLTEAEENRLHD